LRIRAVDLAKIAALIIGKKMMRQPRWHRDSESSNVLDGDVRTYATGFGLMRSEGTDGKPGPWGHHGNAYGFLGGMYLYPEIDAAYVYFIGGTGAKPEANIGMTSRHFIWEETLRKAVEGALLRF
jgi:hypothetical protein